MTAGSAHPDDAVLRYVLAVPVDAFAAFPGWEPVALEPTEVLFLDESLAVRATPGSGDAVVFVDPSDAWRAFCTEVLGFQVPDWAAESEAVRAGNG